MTVRSCAGLVAALLWGIGSAAGQPPGGVELVPQTGHTAGVTAVAFRPGDVQFVSASSDGTAILWDARTGRQLRTYKGGPLSNSFLTVAELRESKLPPTFPAAAKEAPAVTAVEFSRDGRWFVMASRPEGFLAVINANSQATLWDVESGKRLGTFDLAFDAGAVALSPDGKQLLSGGQPMDPAETQDLAAAGVLVRPSTGITLRDLATGQEVRQFGGYDASYEAVRFSPDGRLVLGGGRNLRMPALDAANALSVPPVASEPSGIVFVWDAATGEQIMKLQPQNAVVRVDFAPSGAAILVADAADTLEVWNLKTQQRQWSVRAGIGAFTPDGSRVVAIDAAGRVGIWDVADGKEIQSFATTLEGVRDIAMSADGTRLLIGMTHRSASPRGEAVLLSLANGNAYCSFASRTDPIAAVAVSPSGRHLLVGSGLWDATSGKKRANVCGSPLETHMAAFSSTGQLAWAAHRGGRICDEVADHASAPPANAELATLVEVPSGKEVTQLAGKAPGSRCVAMQFSTDGKRVSTATGDGTLTVWDAADGRRLFESSIPSDNLVAALSPDGPLAAVNFLETKSLWWNRETGEPAPSDGREKGPASRPGIPPQTSRDGKLQVVIADDGLGIVVRETAAPTDRRTLKVELTPHQSIHASGFDLRDDRFVYAEISSPYVGLWDIEAGKRLRQFTHAEPFSAETMRFLPGASRVATAGDDGRIVFWNAATGDRAAVVPLESPILTVASNADGTLMAAGCADRSAVIVRVPSGEKTMLRGHGGPVDAVAFRPDGKLLVTASREDGTARLWDVATGRELARILSVGNHDDWLVVTPEGRYDGSEGGRKLVAFRVGVGLEVRPVDQFDGEFYQPVPGLLGKIWGRE